MNSPFHGVITDDDIAEMNLRTKRRRDEAIARLGHRWLGWVAPKAVPVEAKNVTTIKRAKK